MKDYSMIKKLYLRRKGTSEQPMMSEEQQRLFDEVVLADKNFRQKFSDNREVMELYEKFFDAESDYLSESDEDSYTHGFRVGVLVGLDIAKIFEDK